MPTPEQLAAAERVRRMRKGESYVAVYGTEAAIGNRIGGLSLLDERLLADLALAHLDASRDDGVAVDEAWLRSIGFEEDRESPWGLSLYFEQDFYGDAHRFKLSASDTPNLPDVPWELWCFGSGKENPEGVMLPVIPKTHKQVREILEALHINLAGA